MKKTFLLITCTFLTLHVGAAVLTGTNGKRYSFGQWSVPMALSVDSEDGQVRLVKRSCKIIVESPGSLGFPESVEVDLITGSGAGEVWVGRSYERYFLHRGVIWGMVPRGLDLLLKKSESTDATSGGAEAIIQRALLDHTRDQSYSYTDGVTERLSLSYVFGRHALIPLSESRALIRPVSITGAAIERDRLRISLTSVAGNSLYLELTPDFEPVAASVNGRIMPILFDGKLASITTGWSPPREIGVGNKRAFVISKNFSSLNRAQQNIEVTMKIVVTENGEFWIGPQGCHLALISGNIVGFLVPFEKRQELLIYRSQRTKIVLNREAPSLLRHAIGEFETQFKAGMFREDFNIQIPSLFPNDSEIARDPDIRVDKLVVEGPSVTVRLRTNKPEERLDIEFLADMKVASANKRIR